MSISRAVALAEGYEEGDEDEVLDAWQRLVDTGVAWQLQGTFGRKAAHLISTGRIASGDRAFTPDRKIIV
jgi:hypothetical protein